MRTATTSRPARRKPSRASRREKGPETIPIAMLRTDPATVNKLAIRPGGVWVVNARGEKRFQLVLSHDRLR